MEGGHCKDDRWPSHVRHRKPVASQEVAHYEPETPRRDSIHPLWGREYELLQVQVDDLYIAADSRAYISECLGTGVWIPESDFREGAKAFLKCAL